jgi:hypothetical protein
VLEGIVIKTGHPIWELMHIPKRYGESKLEQCPFCGKQATVRNKQKIPVCQAHRNSVLDDLKCACGSYLETKVGKFGLYFSCPKCGNITSKRVLEMNPPAARSASAAGQAGQGAPKASLKADPDNQNAEQNRRQKPREAVISPDDPDYFG